MFLPFCHKSRVWQTDGRTDRILLAIPRLHCMQRGKNVVIHFRYWTVWSSSQWISESSSGRSSDTIQRHQRTLCGCLWGSGRWGWSDDMHGTTRRLWTSLHMNRRFRRCPGLECWTYVRDGLPWNYLYRTVNSLQTALIVISRNNIKANY